MVAQTSRMAKLFALVAVLIHGAYADCYSHDGITAIDSQYYKNKTQELLSCGRGTNNCCLRGEWCGSNLLCVDSKGFPHRQYCADKNWTNCSTIAAEYNAAGIDLVSCKQNVYCYGAANCCIGGTTYYIDPGTGRVQVASLGEVSTATVSYWSIDSVSVLAAASTAPSSSATPSTSASASATPATTAASASGSAAPPSVVIGTAPPTSSASSSSSPSSSSSSGGLSAGAGAGIAIGCLAALGLIGVLAWLFIRERKKRRLLEAQSGVGAGHAGGQGYTGQAPGYYAPDQGYTAHGYMYQEQPRHEMGQPERPPQEMKG